MLNTINEKKTDGDTPKQAINNEYTAKLRQRKTVDVTVATGMPQTNSSKNPSSQNEDVQDCDDSTATEPLSNVINNKAKMVDLVDITIEDDDATNNKHKPSAAWTIQDWEGTPKDKDNTDSSAMALITPSKKSSDQDCDTDTDREDIQDKAVSTPTRSGSVVDESTYASNRSQQKARPKGTFQRKSEKVQAKLPQHPDATYSRTHQIRFDFRIRLDSIMVENEAKSASVVKFKEMIGKIMEEENTMVLYPYSSSSSAVPITAMARMPNTFIELKRYVPSIKPPLKDIWYMVKYTSAPIPRTRIGTLPSSSGPRIMDTGYSSNTSKMNASPLRDIYFILTRCRIHRGIKPYYPRKVIYPWLHDSAK